MIYILSPTFAPENKTTEGNGYRSLLLFNMASETIIQSVENMVTALMTDQPGDFLVSVRVKPINNIKVFVDSDEGMSIEKCVKYNRRLYAQIEEAAMFPDGDFSLEVSSPGIDEPLKLHRQFLKNIGRNILVTFKDELQKEGKLLEASDADIIIGVTIGKGKKAETQQHVIPFENIKSAVVQVHF